MQSARALSASRTNGRRSLFSLSRMRVLLLCYRMSFLNLIPTRRGDKNISKQTNPLPSRRRGRKAAVAPMHPPSPPTPFGERKLNCFFALDWMRISRPPRYDIFREVWEEVFCFCFCFCVPTFGRGSGRFGGVAGRRRAPRLVRCWTLLLRRPLRGFLLDAALQKLWLHTPATVASSVWKHTLEPKLIFWVIKNDWIKASKKHQLQLKVHPCSLKYFFVIIWHLFIICIKRHLKCLPSWDQ